MKCLTCKHCYIYFGENEFSQFHPETDPEWACRKGKWDLSPGDDKSDVVKAFARGETCDMWESDGRNTP